MTVVITMVGPETVSMVFPFRQGQVEFNIIFMLKMIKPLPFRHNAAEYEYYLLTVTGDVVINEFMASNSSTVADQDGEYDDWIRIVQ